MLSAKKKYQKGTKIENYQKRYKDKKIAKKGTKIKNYQKRYEKKVSKKVRKKYQNMFAQKNDQERYAKLPKNRYLTS